MCDLRRCTRHQPRRRGDLRSDAVVDNPWTGRCSRVGAVAAIGAVLATLATVPSGAGAASGATRSAAGHEVALSGPRSATVGHRFDVTLVARAGGIAAFSATLHYDSRAIEVLD